MIKKISLIGTFIAIMIGLMSYSFIKFKNYNFIKSIYGLNKISNEYPVYMINDNIDIILLSYQDTYVSKLLGNFEKRDVN